MDKEEIKIIVLRRLYNGTFKDGIAEYQADLKDVAIEIGIESGLMERVCVELEREGFLWICALGMIVRPSFKTLTHCESHQLGDKELISKQDNLRKRILEAYADLYEEKLSDRGEGWDEINRRTNINEQDFYNNIGILVYTEQVDKNLVFNFWNITQKGRDAVKDFRTKKQRREEFEKLVDLVAMTPQTRGHKFERLLADVIRDEGWEVDTNVKPRGKEHDIVINRGNDYYLISCKWENEPTEPGPVELLGSRAQEMRCREGVFVSMFGFTDNCIKEALKKAHAAEVVFFGFRDIDQIFLSETTFTDLLKEKIKQIKHKNVILLDGEIRE
ncbi:MAG: restriction endonuclease [Candidatus Aminicenantes bacterium]|nr:restriction endonuclease [Candidatus Aminicenantes bacterium]